VCRTERTSIFGISGRAVSSIIRKAEIESVGSTVFQAREDIITQPKMKGMITGSAAVPELNDAPKRRISPAVSVHQEVKCV